MTETQSYCNICCDSSPFEIPAGDKTEGQICPKCLKTAANGIIYVLKTDPKDEDLRYFPTLEDVKFNLDEGVYYGWYEMNDDERAKYGNVWDGLCDIDATSIESLRATANARMAGLTEWWTRNLQLRVERNSAMNEWSNIKDGSWSKPIDWVKDMPEPFTVIIEEVTL